MLNAVVSERTQRLSQEQSLPASTGYNAKKTEVYSTRVRRREYGVRIKCGEFPEAKRITT